MTIEWVLQTLLNANTWSMVNYLEEKEFGALLFFWRKVENPGTTPSSEMNLYLSGSDCAHRYPIPANLKYLTCDPCEL